MSDGNFNNERRAGESARLLGKEKKARRAQIRKDREDEKEEATRAAGEEEVEDIISRRSW